MKKVKGLIIMLLISLSLFGMTACDGDNEKTPTYEQITAEQAKSIMDTEKDYVIMDVRTEEEFAEGHIENAILIPEYEIKDRAEKELPDNENSFEVQLGNGFTAVSGETYIFTFVGYSGGVPVIEDKCCVVGGYVSNNTIR